VPPRRVGRRTAGYQANTPAPLVLSLHGAGGDAQGGLYPAPAVGRRWRVLVDCLRNARAVAVAGQRWAGTLGVIAASERWPDGTLRCAVEDLVGAGAILSHVPLAERSPGAEAAVAAFRRLVADRPRCLREGASGRELAALGFTDEVTMAAELDVSAVVPSFQHGGAYPSSLTRHEHASGRRAGPGTDAAIRSLEMSGNAQG